MPTDPITRFPSREIIAEFLQEKGFEYLGPSLAPTMIRSAEVFRRLGDDRM